MLNVPLCPWPIDGVFLHQESKERLWLVRERKVPIMEWRYPPGGPSITDGAWPHTPSSWRSVAYGMRTWSCAGTLVRLSIALVRPSSWGLHPAPSCRGLVWDFVLFFLLRTILVSPWASGVLLGGPLGVLRVSVVCLLALVWWIQGAMPATLTERSVPLLPSTTCWRENSRRWKAESFQRGEAPSPL